MLGKSGSSRHGFGRAEGAWNMRRDRGNSAPFVSLKDARYGAGEAEAACSSRVISRHRAVQEPCPLYPRKRTLRRTLLMSPIGRFCCRSRRFGAGGGCLNFLRRLLNAPLS